MAIVRAILFGIKTARIVPEHRVAIYCPAGSLARSGWELGSSGATPRHATVQSPLLASCQRQGVFEGGGGRAVAV